MREPPEEVRLREERRRRTVLGVLTVVFATLAVAQLAHPPEAPPPRARTPDFDPARIDYAPQRPGYADLVRAGEDVSHFRCYLCHERGQPPVLQFDDRHRVVLPDEHADIVMAHGGHERNNHCFNCHNEQNRETLQVRDGRKLPFTESSQLCGSCHGPTFSDWEVGVHGRISGFWDRSLGPAHRLDCVNCHDPHAPRLPPRAPLPGPARPPGQAPQSR